MSNWIHSDPVSCLNIKTFFFKSTPALSPMAFTAAVSPRFFVTLRPTLCGHSHFCSIFIKWRLGIKLCGQLCVYEDSLLLKRPIFTPDISLNESTLSPRTECTCPVCFPPLQHTHIHTRTYWICPSNPPPPPPQWTEAGAGWGGQSLPPAVTAESLQPALLHPLLLALHVPAQPQAHVQRLPLQRLQGLPGVQQAGRRLALHRLPEEQVRLVLRVFVGVTS